MTTHSDIADLIFPDNIMDTDAIEAKYPPRNLNEGEMVVRMAPSPTGFVHLGAIYMGLINDVLAEQAGGVSMLRIEDTDQERQIDDGINIILSAFENFDITFGECATGDGGSRGDYGPYIQSQRVTLYRSYAKKLIAEGKAYPCFCTPEELDQMREEQMAKKERTGYYGSYAKYRDLSPAEAKEKLDTGLPYVIRMKSNGNYDNRIDVKDIVKGKRSLPQNDIDPVIIKAKDGLPTYHFAHVVDDYLMRTTHVIRGDEWFSSLPLHMDMFYTMGWKAPKYAHLSPIQKMDGEGKRKLSKRKDPEANIEFFLEQGYPVDAIVEYLLNLANSGFEDWRKQNPTAPARDFKLDLKKTSPSGALFDMDKLDNISKNIIGEYTNTQVYDLAVKWAEKYDANLHTRLVENETYLKEIFSIEREGKRKRKDIVKWSGLENEIAYFFDDLFDAPSAKDLRDDEALVKSCLSAYMDGLDPADDRNTWWEKAAEAAKANNFATDMKYYKEHPDEFNGNIADFMTLIRTAITGRADAPDIYEISRIMGLDQVKTRLGTFL